MEIDKLCYLWFFNYFFGLNLQIGLVLSIPFLCLVEVFTFSVNYFKLWSPFWICYFVDSVMYWYLGLINVHSLVLRALFLMSLLVMLRLLLYFSPNMKKCVILLCLKMDQWTFSTLFIPAKELPTNC